MPSEGLLKESSCYGTSHHYPCHNNILKTMAKEEKSPKKCSSILRYYIPLLEAENLGIFTSSELSFSYHMLSGKDSSMLLLNPFNCQLYDKSITQIFICKSTMRENRQAELTGLQVNCHLSFLSIHKANLVALVQCLQPCHTLQGSLPQILQHSNLDHVVKITVSNNDC